MARPQRGPRPGHGAHHDRIGFHGLAMELTMTIVGSTAKQWWPPRLGCRPRCSRIDFLGFCDKKNFHIDFATKNKIHHKIYEENIFHRKTYISRCDMVPTNVR